MVGLEDPDNPGPIQAYLIDALGTAMAVGPVSYGEVATFPGSSLKRITHSLRIVGDHLVMYGATSPGGDVGFYSIAIPEPTAFMAFVMAAGAAGRGRISATG